MLVAAVFLQVPIALGLGGVLVLLEPPDLGLGRKAVPLVLVQPPPSPEPEEDEPEELDPELLEGQIVEIAPPEDPTPPEEADYLAEVDSSVVEETRTDRFEINPEVLAPRWSEEQRFEQEDLVDLNIEKESTGATVGVESFDPAKNGTLSSLPANWTLTNKDGLQDPVPAAHSEAFLSGAPQNDLLDEALGSEVALNARELVYAAYINRIRRLVNYYWRQNINNMPSSVRLTKARYRTVVKAVLDRDGALELIEITSSSGEDVVDDCLVRAFRLAGPFPNPPATLVKSDGRVYLPDFDFTYRLGQAQNQYQGVDPRAGVQFPGILKAPR
ncbi:MAG: TonB C-terminal domain-containing protein [Myxococcota bacterium]